MRVKLPWWSLRQMFSNFILSFPSVTNGQSDKCKDCAAGQCATHCYVLLLRWGCDKDKGGNDHSEISLLKNQPSWLKLCLAASGNRLKDGYKYEKSKVKKVKRTIPAWASVTASKKVPVTNFAGTQNKVDNILIEAITVCANTVKWISWHTAALSIIYLFVVRFLCSLAMTGLEFHTNLSWNISWKNTQGWSLTGRSSSSRSPWRNIWRREPSSRWRSQETVRSALFFSRICGFKSTCLCFNCLSHVVEGERSFRDLRHWEADSPV